MSDEITVTRNAERSRYEIRVGDRRAGFVMYKEREDGPVVVFHTEVAGEFKGMGLASRLAADALGDLARRGRTVKPTCPFIQHYLREHDVPGLTLDWPERDGAAASAAPSEPS